MRTGRSPAFDRGRVAPESAGASRRPARSGRDRPPCRGIRDAYLAATGNPTHFTDVTATIDAGIASLREHRAYLDGLGGEFDPDEFRRNMAGFIGLAADCDYAVGFRRYPMG
jgi:hypothetical protein